VGEDERQLEKVSSDLARTQEPSKNVFPIIVLAPPGCAAYSLHQYSAGSRTFRKVAGMPTFVYLLPNLI
jgi:hypothetical protein